MVSSCSTSKVAIGWAAAASASRTSMRLRETEAVPKFVRCNSYIRYVRPSLGNAVGSNGTRISSCTGQTAGLAEGC
jgi:hypothetical protein